MAKGACVAKGGHVWQRGHAWQKGGMHGEGKCAWQKRGCAWYVHPPHEIRPVIARAVRILLECILVLRVNPEQYILIMNICI